MSEHSAKRASWLVPALVVGVAAVLVGFVIALTGGGDEAPADRADSGELFPYDIGVERRDAADPLAFGDVDAPVTMVVFSDFQCPYCAQWSKDAFPQLLDRTESGQLRIEMRDLSVFGDESRRAAQAAYAAALQDRYLDYHNALFADGKKRPAGELSEDALVATAGRLGLDTDRFRADMNSETTNLAVDENEQTAETVGAYSTPSFILGGQPIAGAAPADAYLDKLDALLPDGK